MRPLITETVDLLNVPYVDAGYNQTKPDYSAGTVIASGRATVQPFLSNEDDINRETTNQQFRLITDDPSLFVATAKNAIRRYGVVYRIDGEPFVWYLNGKIHHVEMNLQIIKG